MAVLVKEKIEILCCPSHYLSENIVKISTWSQCVKKVMSDTLTLLDLVAGLVDSVFHLPKKELRKFKLQISTLPA